jgi:hypothetical protein
LLKRTVDVIELFERHALTELAQYRGNLRYCEKVLKAGELPDVRDPLVHSHVQKLQHFLAEKGIQEGDEFLLGLGLMAPGSFRGIRPALEVLSPERGGFSEKRLQEAADQVVRFREALTLGYHFFPTLSRDTAIAIQELSGLFDSGAISDEDWTGHHAALSPAETEELTDRALRCLDSSSENVKDVGNSVLQTLADCRRDGLGAATLVLAERRIYYPGSLYRGAPDAVARMLADHIAGTDVLELNHLLLALAWTRGEVAQDVFLKWGATPPVWASQLHVPPEKYVHSAGWTLDTGTPRDLISLGCHLIVKGSSRGGPGVPVPCRVPIDSYNCPNCGGQATWLFDFTAVPAGCLLGDYLEAPRKVLCCLSCACFGPVFTRYIPDGGAEWHPVRVSSAPAPTGDRPSCSCHLSPSAFPPFAAANPFRLNDASILGGIPMWLQDSEYPCCPDCEMSMRFLAQFDNSAMPTPEEGIYYAFFCLPCRVAAVSYQQT